MTRPHPIPARIVLKFGGTSVGDLEAWTRIEAILRRTLGEGTLAADAPRVLVVHSALPGVTDALERVSRGDLEPMGWVEQAHEAFARELLGGSPGALADELQLLRERVSALAESAGEGAPPARLQAAILATGERLATLVSAAWLERRGTPTVWLDARELLTARENGGAGGDDAAAATGATGVPSSRDARRWLSAECDAELDTALRTRLDGLEAIGLTQGFTAAGPGGETVVLGRGGSDTAAAYLAGRWGADRLEIWSDVPGMFTADPRRMPAARLIRELSYDEAQEIATTGSRVLHPRCIPALRERGIPIHLRSTLLAGDAGTVIRPAGPEGASQLKAISWKRDVVLVSMETVGMWQEVGFLARAFAEFGRAGLSVDLVSTSETNVTASLDAAANLLDPEQLSGMVERLSTFCQVEVIRPCAAVSMVGNRIRGMLHRLAPALSVFEEHRIHLVSQAANDLNFTVVVDADQGERLARKLHRMLMAEPAPAGLFGPSWSELMQEGPAEGEAPWWLREREALLEHFAEADAAYVYHLDTVRARLRELQGLSSVGRVLYAMKANPNRAVLEVVRAEGGGFECVSRGEIERVLETFPELPPGEILFTPNFAPRAEYAWALGRGVQVTLDALHPIVHWPELFDGRDLFVRVDPGEGAGHHEKVSTGGLRSKFGVTVSDLDELGRHISEAGARVTGLHVHAGSGILTAEHWPRMGRFLLEVADRFPEARVLDLGGGLPVPQSPGEAALDLEALDRSLAEVNAARPELDLWLEPGRFVVAEAGVLLARVTQIKQKGHVHYVGLATGMNSLIRPALYGSFHDIVNLSRIGEPRTERVQVVGPICESGDRLGIDRMLPPTREGDLLLIAGTGAYGRAMSSEYNLRAPAAEFAMDSGSTDTRATATGATHAGATQAGGRVRRA